MGQITQKNEVQSNQLQSLRNHDKEIMKEVESKNQLYIHV